MVAFYAAVFTRAEPVVGPLSAWLSRRADPPPSRSPGIQRRSTVDIPQPLVPRPTFHREESSDLGHVTADRQRSQLYPPAVSGGAVWRDARFRSRGLPRDAVPRTGSSRFSPRDRRTGPPPTRHRRMARAVDLDVDVC